MAFYNLAFCHMATLNLAFCHMATFALAIYQGSPKSGPVFIVKVVDSVVIEANPFYKSSSISSKYYFYSIKRSFQQSKKDFVENGQFQ